MVIMLSLSLRRGSHKVQGGSVKRRFKGAFRSARWQEQRCPGGTSVIDLSAQNGLSIAALVSVVLCTGIQNTVTRKTTAGCGSEGRGLNPWKVNACRWISLR